MEGFQDFAALAENHESAFEEFHVLDAFITSSKDGIPVLSIGAAEEFRIKNVRIFHCNQIHSGTVGNRSRLRGSEGSVG